MKERELQTIYLTNAKLWREWLEEHHDHTEGVWLIYYKKHTGIPRVPYNNAVEEALCFGWIDSIVKKIDEERYMQKFTPRRPKSGWSAINKKRVEKLIGLDKIEKAGLEAINIARQNGKWDETNETTGNQDLTGDFLTLLQSNTIAYEYYTKLPPSHKKQYNNWVMSAKKPETRLKRCREMISMLESGKNLGMK